MAKLHELIAVEPDLKSEATRVLGEVQNLFANGAGRLVSQLRRYRPLEDEGEKLPDESTELATTVNDEIKVMRSAFSRWLDVSIQKELSNSKTKADVVIDGVTILAGMSAPALLNLESKLSALRSVYAAIPTNDPSEKWEFESQQGVYVSSPKESYRTKKVMKSIVGAAATENHPANVQYYQEDIREGVWTTTKRSGMLSPTEKRNLLERVDAMLRAVKSARQRANDTDAETVKVSDKVFDFIHRE
jgi:hypothetical protein